MTDQEDKMSLKQIAVALAVALLLAVADGPESTAVAAGCDGSSGAYLYKNEFFGGDCLRVSADLSDINHVDPASNDTTDSIQLVGIPYVRVCEHADGGGQCVEFTSSQSRMAPFGMENKISSVYFEAPDRGSCDGGPGAYLYFNEFYGGSCMRVIHDISDLNTHPWLGTNFNDQIDSVQLVGIAHVRVCEGADGGAICADLNASQSRMAPFSLENKISSVYVDPVPDGDGDGMPDAYEILHSCLNPSVADGTLDPDGDGLSNLEEQQRGSDPCNPYTAGDGYTDGQHVTLGKNPLAYCGIMRADVNMDGRVGLADFIIVAAWYGKNVPPAPARHDQNADGMIRLADFIIMAGVYNRSVTDCP